MPRTSARKCPVHFKPALQFRRAVHLHLKDTEDSFDDNNVHLLATEDRWFKEDKIFTTYRLSAIYNTDLKLVSPSFAPLVWSSWPLMMGEKKRIQTKFLSFQVSIYLVVNGP